MNAFNGLYMYMKLVSIKEAIRFLVTLNAAAFAATDRWVGDLGPMPQSLGNSVNYLLGGPSNVLRKEVLR